MNHWKTLCLWGFSFLQYPNHIFLSENAHFCSALFRNFAADSLVVAHRDASAINETDAGTFSKTEQLEEHGHLDGHTGRSLFEFLAEPSGTAERRVKNVYKNPCAWLRGDSFIRYRRLGHTLCNTILPLLFQHRDTEDTEEIT